MRNSNYSTGTGGKWPLDAVFLILLFATLPLFSLRSLTFGYSLTLFLLIAVTIRESIRLMLVDSRNFAFDRLDVYIFLYLVVATFASTYTVNENYKTALLKSTFYFVSYLAVKLYFRRFSIDRLQYFVVLGIKVGLAFFGIASLYALVVTGQVAGIFGDLSYWGFTFKIFSALNEVLGSSSGVVTEFESRLVMKNSIGETFALFTIVLYLIHMQGVKRILPLVVVSAILVFLTFSRRSILEITLAYLFITAISFREEKKSVVGTKVFLTVSVILMVIILIPSYDSRFGQIGEERRFGDLAIVFEQVRGNWISGYGYAAKVSGEKYVHNYLLGSFYMMGILGFVSAFLVYFELLRTFVSRMFLKPDASAALLAIPLVSSMVASTVEGIFTPPSWIAIALFLSLGASRRLRNKGRIQDRNRNPRSRERSRTRINA